MNKLIIISLFALISLNLAHDVETENHVLVLTDANFEHVISEHKHILVEFYAPWCGHCKKLTPEYAGAAAALEEEGSEVKLAKLDATAHPDAAGKFGVRGYPTLKFFVNGNAIPYEGGRTKDEIVSWLKSRTQAKIEKVETSEALNHALENNKVAVVFWGDDSHADWVDFDLVSRAFDDVHFVHTTHSEFKASHNVDSDDVVTLFKHFDEKQAELEGEITYEALENFINNHKFPTIMDFDQKVAQKIFSDGKAALFLMVQKDSQGEKATQALNDVAGKLKGHILLSISDIDEGLGSKLAEFVGVSRSELPAARIIVPGGGAAPKKYKMSEEITADNLFHFYEKFNSGSLTTYKKSEPVPAEQTEAVIVVVGETYNDIVMNNDNDVLVEYYAPWCGHCKHLAPEYLSAAEQLKSVKGLTLAKVDSTANEIDGVEIKGYPTIKFYPSGKKSNPIDFDGERNAAGIVSWLKTHATHAFSQHNEDL